MTRYAKPRRRNSERKGWRPTAVSQLSNGVALSDLENAGKRLTGILDNNHIPNEEELVLLSQALLLCRRITAYWANDPRLLDELNIRLRDNQDILQNKGLGRRGIHQNLWISRVVADRNRPDKLKNFLKQVEGKMAEVKK